MEIIRLKPVFKQMIWGGSKLKTDFGYDVEGDNVGECWGISAHPNGDCEIAQGEYKGKRLSWLYKEHRELFGNIPNDVFPLLTKIIDAKQDLSIQVHPDDEYAKANENGSLGKTECWYVLDAEPGTTIVIGHNASSKEEVEKMIMNKEWSSFIREIPVKKGDFFQINPGTVHAIKGGTLILESQQNSDITYRVYDYDRLSDGKPRPLHVRQSIDVIKAPYVEESGIDKNGIDANSNNCDVDNACGVSKLVSCPYYTVWKVDVEDVTSFSMDRSFMLASVVEGQGEINGEELKKGDHFIIPYGFGEVVLQGELQLIISTPYI